LEDIRLTPTSYIVLGLLTQAGEATPYELKAMVAGGIGNLWSLQHTQLYAEPERLTRAGYLAERREEGGRRRRLYRIAEPGRAAFRAWLSGGPARDLPELRDISLLKVFFGADPGPIARAQVQAHRAKLREYEELERAIGGEASGALTALRAGLGHEREWVRYWAGLSGEPAEAAEAAEAGEAGEET
jgi:PadR family transcriptional regulator, regulatory protein AphA